LRKIYPPEEVEAEIQIMSESTEMEMKQAEVTGNITMAEILYTLLPPALVISKFPFFRFIG
jgi:SP family myo-inositol transporter-like MFS transporter 13